ncbi:MAG: helix-turn-helix transcriptional regulator [Bacteroidota bacterium]
MQNEIKLESSSPGEELSYFIREIFCLQIDSDRAQTMVAIDDGCYDFMFYKEKEATLEFEHTNSIEINSNFLTVHQLNPPLKYRFGKSVSYFGIKAQPWLNSYFFPRDYEKGVLNLAHIYRGHMREVQAILESESFTEKVQAAKEFIAKIKPEHSETLDLIKRVCEEIYERKGMVTVYELSEKFEHSRQLLNKIFKAHVNYTLKKFIITVRIISLAKFRINTPHYSLTEVAHEFGYFDQAHFNYDFKRISGVSPKMFFKDLPPFFHRHKNL